MKSVYIIEERPRGFCKIGITNDPQRRLNQLQVGHAGELSLAHSIYLPQADEVEVLVHEALGDRHIKGEWFRVTAAEALIAIGIAVGRLGLAEHAFSQQAAPDGATPLQAWRLRNKLSLTELAERLGVCHTTLSRVERGVVQPRMGLEHRIAKLTGLTYQEIALPRIGGRAA